MNTQSSSASNRLMNVNDNKFVYCTLCASYIEQIFKYKETEVDHVYVLPGETASVDIEPMDVVWEDVCLKAFDIETNEKNGAARCTCNCKD